MTKIIFKNLEKSEIAKEAASVRIQGIVEKFPDLVGHRIQVTLSMENSPQQPGPDLFTVKLFIDGKRYRSIVIQKSSANLYTALAEVVDHALERLNRYGDKVRVRRRKSGTQAQVRTEMTLQLSDSLDG
jgi:ribosome-associated translation inhibitor RaiA